MFKVGMSGAGGEDQIIVVDFQIDCFHLFGLDVYGLHFRKDHFYVPAFAQDCADRCGNVGR